MPFTFAHPAAVLPLVRLRTRYISVTGLVIGSVIPDFEYFLRMKANSLYSHTWLGLLWFDLPLAIIISFVFHSIVRDPLINNLPNGLYRRFSAYIGFNWQKHFLKNSLWIIFSFLIGGATHIFWDGFTHQNGYFVEHISKLSRPVHVAGNETTLYNLLQHLSSVIGSAIVLFAVIRLPKQKINFKKQNTIIFWPTVFIISAIVVLMRVFFTGLSHNDMAGDIIFTVISSLMIGVSIAAEIQLFRKNAG
jgi:hypothetical protein